MSATPFQILCLAPKAPDLVTSAFGPFVILPCANLAEVDEHLNQHPFDALLVDLSGPVSLDKLTHWTGLPRAVLESAVVVVGREPLPADCLKLLQLGVRDVLSARETHSESLGRSLRLVIERKRLDDAARRA